jgi:integrase
MAVCSRTLQNGKKRYFARITDPATGRKISSPSFNRRKDAEMAETEMKARVYRGESAVPRPDVLFSVFADELMQQCTAGKHTRDEYEHIQKWFANFFGKKSVRQITVQDCEKAVAKLDETLAPNTITKYVVRLRYVFRRAVAYGYMSVSPADGISNKPKAVNLREIQTLEVDEIKQLLATADDYWRPLFTLWLATGMRRSEIFGLDVSCLDVANNRVHVRQQLKDGVIVTYTKNKKPRTVPVTPEIMGIVTAHAEAVPRLEGVPRLVFPSKTGKPVHYSDFHRDIFKPLVASIGRPSMGTHDLRHTFASQALSQGVSLKALQTILGHSDASLTLNRYSHLIPSDSQVAAEKMADLLLREEPVTRIGHSELVPPVIVEVA